MDVSPLAQLNNRQQPFVISPVEDLSLPWDDFPQRQHIRPNPLQRGPFARSFNSSFGSFSSNSAVSSSSTYTNATSATTATGSGYFDLHRSNCDLLSPMASLTADMSANFSLDPRYIPLEPFLTLVRVQDFPHPDDLFSLHYHLDHNLVDDNNHLGQLLPMNIPLLALIRIPLPILPFLINYPLHNHSHLPFGLAPHFRTSRIV